MASYNNLTISCFKYKNIISKQMLGYKTKNKISMIIIGVLIFYDVSDFYFQVDLKLWTNFVYLRTKSTFSFKL